MGQKPVEVDEKLVRAVRRGGGGRGRRVGQVRERSVRIILSKKMTMKIR